MIKKHLSRDGQLRRFGGLAGTTDSGNRGHATSDNKTNIRVAIFPNPWAFEFSRNVAAALSGWSGMSGLRRESTCQKRARAMRNDMEMLDD
jgi:hypothetical protein